MMTRLPGRIFRRGPGSRTGLRRFLFLIPIVAILAACRVVEVPREESGPETRSAEDPGPEITAMLMSSAESWNAGDLDGFLDDYWHSEDLTFSGGSGVTRGWDGVRERYQQSYWAPGATRDSLRFEDLEIMPLGEDHALAMGRYVLFRPQDGGEEVTGTGYFSLVLRRTAAGWKIIHDHTSASPPSGDEG